MQVQYAGMNGPKGRAQELAWGGRLQRLFKRGVYGEFYHIGEGHLPVCLAAPNFRAGGWEATDVERFAALMSQSQGRSLWYCQTPQLRNANA